MIGYRKNGTTIIHTKGVPATGTKSLIVFSFGHE